jgi:hypothetical protein
MSWKQCENGHTYDPAVNHTCPYCGIADLDMQTTKRMQSTRDPKPDSDSDRNSTDIPTRPYHTPHPANPNRSHNTPDDPATIRILDDRLGFDPVVGGWCALKAWIGAGTIGSKARKMPLAGPKTWISALPATTRFPKKSMPL